MAGSELAHQRQSTARIRDRWPAFAAARRAHLAAHSTERTPVGEGRRDPGAMTRSRGGRGKWAADLRKG